MTRIAEHLSVADLERRYRAAQEVTEARHTQADLTSGPGPHGGWTGIVNLAEHLRNE